MEKKFLAFGESPSKTYHKLQTCKASSFFVATVKKCSTYYFEYANALFANRALNLFALQVFAFMIVLRGDSSKRFCKNLLAVFFLVTTILCPTVTCTASSDSANLTGAEQAELLKIAKNAVEGYVKTGRKWDIKNTLPALDQKLGAFVTLKEHGELRGCIGRFEPNIPLYQVVQNMAIAAATEDPRFRPVIPEELPLLKYEISVLSPLRPVKSYEEIEMGKHGVEVVRGFQGGVFLPQVATETGWDRATFLSTLCSQKAGLPSDCWKDPGTKLLVFTAQVFGDETSQPAGQSSPPAKHT